jgi:hypothetical protein
MPPGVVGNPGTPPVIGGCPVGVVGGVPPTKNLHAKYPPTSKMIPTIEK